MSDDLGWRNSPPRPVGRTIYSPSSSPERHIHSTPWAVMSFQSVPIWVLFVGTILAVMLSIEMGYRMGRTAHRREEVKESPISSIAGAILALLAFMLAFTFGIVSARWDTRKALVLAEANAVRTAYQRSDFLPASDRAEARRLFREYLDLRLAFLEEGTIEQARLNEFLVPTVRIQDRLWKVAVDNARLDMNSDVAALYIESLNEIIETHASRLVIGAQVRTPTAIWVVLFCLVVLGMVAMGLHIGITGSKRSMSTWILAISFAMVIAVIAALERPTGFIRVAQRPLIDLRHSLEDRE